MSRVLAHVTDLMRQYNQQGGSTVGVGGTTGPGGAVQSAAAEPAGADDEEHGAVHVGAVRLAVQEGSGGSTDDEGESGEEGDHDGDW